MRLCTVLLASIILLAAALPSHSHADEILTIEAEGFDDSYNIGLETIRSMLLTGCSAGYVLYGFDYPNEWVEYYSVRVDTLGFYVPRIIFRGEPQVQYQIQLIFTPCGEGTVSEVAIFNVTGTGFG